MDKENKFRPDLSLYSNAGGTFNKEFWRATLLEQPILNNLSPEEHSWLAVFYDSKKYPSVRSRLESLVAPENSSREVVLEILQRDIREHLNQSLDDLITIMEVGEVFNQEEISYLRRNYENGDVREFLASIFLFREQGNQETADKSMGLLRQQLPNLMEEEKRSMAELTAEVRDKQLKPRFVELLAEFAKYLQEGPNDIEDLILNKNEDFQEFMVLLKQLRKPFLNTSLNKLTRENKGLLSGLNKIRRYFYPDRI